MNKAREGLVVAGLGLLLAVLGPGMAGSSELLGIGGVVFLIGLGMTLWAVVGDKSKEASKD